jgi:hypothetical protein
MTTILCGDDDRQTQGVDDDKRGHVTSHSLHIDFSVVMTTQMRQWWSTGHLANKEQIV